MEVEKIVPPPAPQPPAQVVVTLSEMEAKYLCAFLDVVLWSSIKDEDAKKFIVELESKLCPLTAWVNKDEYFQDVSLND